MSFRKGERVTLALPSGATFDAICEGDHGNGWYLVEISAGVIVDVGVFVGAGFTPGMQNPDRVSDRYRWWLVPEDALRARATERAATRVNKRAEPTS